MLDKITDEMLERLESQLSDTIAFISHFIAQSEDDSNKLFLPCLRYTKTRNIFQRNFMVLNIFNFFKILIKLA